MELRGILGRNTLANYAGRIKSTPREVIFSPSLIISSMMYASSAIPLTWDQGSASTVASLPGFQQHFGIRSGSNAEAIRNIVSLVYIGDAAGAALSFFFNDRIGRLWSFRLYTTVWIIGQLVALSSPGIVGLYAARIVSGLGIGALSVTGSMSIVEIAPAEIRGLLTAWYSVSMALALMAATLCVYGVQLHIATSRLQYQVVYFAPCVFMALWIVTSFFLCESPRWLLLSDQQDEALKTLVRLRCLPAHHPRVQHEFQSIMESLRSESEGCDVNYRSPSKIVSSAKEMFLVPSNLRRVQQVLILYMFPQVSGGNSITNYFIPVLEIIGLAGDSTRHLFLSGMYAMSKFFFCLFASFFFIDTLGRRNSLFIGIIIQMISDLYLGAYIKVQQDDGTSRAASKAALAAIFVHAFGFSIGLLTLPYVFGGELWPNRIRSFGSAMSQTFHWLFHYAMTFGTPSLLAETDNWGAFIFFAAWCFIALLYVYLLVPEVSGYTVEEIDGIFNMSWRVTNKRKNRESSPVLEGQEVDRIPSHLVETSFPTTKNAKEAHIK